MQTRILVLAALLSLSSFVARACEKCARLATTGVIASGKGRLWSDPGTWAGGKLPATDEAVVIPAGKRVTLDVSPPRLASLFVKGELIWADVDLELQTGWILASGEGALLQIGTEKQPFPAKAVITLLGIDDHFSMKRY